MVDHAILIKKKIMSGQCNVPTFIIKWISFLSSRMQATTFLGKLSTLVKIKQSVVQEIGIGPTLFITFACDLRTIDSLNHLLKHDDNSTLICPEKFVITVEDKMASLVR
jgi:hypothetical protein